MFRVRPVFDPQTEANERKLFLIQAHLEVFVPIAIGEIKQQDGPTDLQFDRARGIMATKPDPNESEKTSAYFAPFRRNNNPLAAHGDAFLFGGKPGEAGTYMSQLTWALAVMAFSLGGVTAFDLHFDATKPEWEPLHEH